MSCHSLSVCTSVRSDLLLCVCVCVCLRVSLHALYALSACSQLIKTQCQLSCFLPACLLQVQAWTSSSSSSSFSPASSLRLFNPFLTLGQALSLLRPALRLLSTSLDLPSPPFPSLSSYSTPTLSKLETSHCQTRPRMSHALFNEKNILSLKSQT